VTAAALRDPSAASPTGTPVPVDRTTGAGVGTSGISGFVPSPEAALLLRAARMAGDAGDFAAPGIDPARLMALAERHRMIPLLHRHLRAASLPAEVAAGLRARAAAEARRSLALAGELRRVMDALDSAGAAALAYKGPPLAIQAYGELSLRSFADLDLLVRPADVPRALAALARAGYHDTLGLAGARERWFRRVDGDYPLLHRSTRTLVELHARVSTLRFGVDVDTDALLRRARTVAIGGAGVRTLGDDDLLLVLFVHGAKHRWRRLEWLAAVAALLRAGRGDAVRVLEHASALRARRTVLLGLHLADALLGAPVADEVKREIAADAEIASLAADVVARMFGAEPVEEGDDTRGNLRFNLRLRDGAAERAKYVARWLFGPTPEDWKAVDLPDALFPLYRVVRPLRLLARHGRAGGGG